jgi:hypothetical protein
MRKLLSGFALGLIGLLLSPGATPAQTTTPRTEDRLVGTWECISPELGNGYRHIKHVTPTHFTWVTYNRETMVPLYVAGGTWSLEGDIYTERIQFAGEAHEALRGKEYRFTLKLEGDRWFLKSTPGSELAVDEVWKPATR